jgi:hypothetical protein
MALLQFGVTYLQCFEEADEFIVDYAEKLKAFGILGQDTDFVVNPKTARYITLNNLIVSKEFIKGWVYTPDSLSKSLKINPKVRLSATQTIFLFDRTFIILNS